MLGYPEAALSRLLTAGILHGLWHKPLLLPLLLSCPLYGCSYLNSFRILFNWRNTGFSHKLT